MSALIYKNESYKLVGACFEVYKLNGIGFTEPVYQECLEYERIVNSRNLAKTRRAAASSSSAGINDNSF